MNAGEDGEGGGGHALEALVRAVAVVRRHALEAFKYNAARLGADEGGESGAADALEAFKYSLHT